MLAELKAQFARIFADADSALAREDMATFQSLAPQYHATANAILAITGADPRVN